MYSFMPFPILTTERLILRQLKAEDAPGLFALRSSEVAKYFVENPKAYTLEDAQRHIRHIRCENEKNEWIVWTITLKEQTSFIGSICLWNISQEQATAEIGYELLPGYHGKGIMREALATVVQYGFGEMRLRAIEAFPRRDNQKSIALLEYSGFVRKDDFCSKREIAGNLIYVLANEDFGR